MGRLKNLYPSAPLPCWLLALWQGRLSEVQDELAQMSGTPMSLGHWLLFASAAVLVSAGSAKSIGEWAQSCQWTSGPKRPTEGPGHSGRSSAFDGLSAMARDRSPAAPLANEGASRRDFAETVILIQRYPMHYMAGPWKLLTTWESVWPGKVHPPLPLPLLKALVTTALTWQWTCFTLALLIGYFALLRPCELLALKVSDSSLTSETGFEDVVFIRLHLVKSRTRGVRMQSVRLDVPFVVSFLKKCLQTMHPNEKIWCYSTSLFRTGLQMALERLTGYAQLCVPSSLRAGGATFWFRQWNEDIARLQWRGRWLHAKTLNQP